MVDELASASDWFSSATGLLTSLAGLLIAVTGVLTAWRLLRQGSHDKPAEPAPEPARTRRPDPPSDAQTWSGASVPSPPPVAPVAAPSAHKPWYVQQGGSPVNQWASAAPGVPPLPVSAVHDDHSTTKAKWWVGLSATSPDPKVRTSVRGG